MTPKTLRLLAFGLVLWTLAAPLCAVSLHAANNSHDLERIETELSEQKHRATELDEKAKLAGETLKNLQRQLIEATEALTVKSSEEAQLEDKLDNLQADISVKKLALADEQKKLKAFTAALLELARQPLETLFLQTDLTTQYVHRTIIMRALIPRLKGDVVDMARDLVALNRMRTDLAEQKQIVTAAQRNLQRQQQDLDQLIRARQGLLQRTEADKEAIAKQLVALTSEAKDLRQLLDKITPEHSQKNTPNLRVPGDLKWPVNGRIARHFGEKDSDGVISQGLTFSTLAASPVVAPRSGRVVFAGPFRGYGQIVILQHDGGYHSFLAGFGRIDVEMGQSIEKGEPIGVLPVTGDRRSELYFEWRHNSEPVDPEGGITLSKGR